MLPLLLPAVVVGFVLGAAGSTVVGADYYYSIGIPGLEGRVAPPSEGEDFTGEDFGFRRAADLVALAPPLPLEKALGDFAGAPAARPRRRHAGRRLAGDAAHGPRRTGGGRDANPPAQRADRVRVLARRARTRSLPRVGGL